tara:strand:- start:1221 stop:1640 length:420 start_codon:yes stop_codon:yes gene_type:complete
MARFRATIKGSGNEVSRQGHSSSGIEANVNGWKVGVRVASMDTEDDAFGIYSTRGSAPSGYSETLIGVVVLDDEKNPIFEESLERHLEKSSNIDILSIYRDCLRYLSEGDKFCEAKVLIRAIKTCLEKPTAHELSEEKV